MGVGGGTIGWATRSGRRAVYVNDLHEFFLSCFFLCAGYLKIGSSSFKAANLPADLHTTALSAPLWDMDLS